MTAPRPARARLPKRSDIELRDMEIDDLPVVFHMGERTFTSEIPNLYRTWDEYEVTTLFTTEPDFCMVGEDRTSGRLAGFALGTTVTKARSSWKYGYLLWMAVDESYRKLGVGERLVRHLAAKMVEEGVRILLVDTDAENQAAIDFFKAQGFEQPRSHVYMSLNLDSLRRRRRARKKA
jgi:ribosomal protein S18 acetylase RimI-like enzyme